MPQTLSDNTRIAGTELSNTPLYPFVSSISVTRVKDMRRALWSPISAGFISVQVHELRELLASKNTKVPEYLQRCDEIWLLIVADGSYISSTGELSEAELRQAHLPSLFQKVLFYDRPNRLITTLTG
jgi:hypothetical protein